VITVTPGKHRRPRRRAVAGAALPAAKQRTLLADPDWPPSGAGHWPQWEAPSPLLSPDHPSAPVPRVRAPLMPGAGGAGRGPTRSSNLGVPRSRPNVGPSRGNGRRQSLADMQTRSGPIAPDAGAQPRGTAGSAGQPGFGYGGQVALARPETLNETATIREAAKRDAAAIRQEAAVIQEPAENEAAHLRAVILSLSEQLSEMSTYITENLVTPGGLATIPVSATAPAPTLSIAPPKPRTGPDAPVARPTGPRTTSARQPQGRRRQFQAMRVATVATAALFSVAAVSGTAEIGMHGFKFFTFRETGAGETGPNGGTDQDFLAKEAAAAKAAAQAHTPGKHSAKTTSG
jgi:hypothetical protein